MKTFIYILRIHIWNKRYTKRERIKAFIEYSNDTNNVFEEYNKSKNIEEYNPNKGRKISIVFDGVIVDMLSNKKTSANSNRIIYQI